MRRAPAILALILLASATATTAHWLARASLGLFLPPASGVGIGGSGTGAAPGAGVQSGRPAPGSRRVILVLADGLAVRDARRMPVLERLARQGAFYTVTGPDPAWALPAWATVLTGTEPMVHRALLMERPVTAVPTVLNSVRVSGARTAAAGSPLLLALLDRDLTQKFAVLPGSPLAETIRSALAARAEFSVIQLDALHPLDHRLSVRQSKDLLMDLDAAIGTVTSDINLIQDTLVVAGTFAATADGSHGDGSRPVPVVLAGSGVRAGVQGQADLRAVAPTLTALLSVPRLAAATSQPLPQALSAAPAPIQLAMAGAAGASPLFSLFSPAQWVKMWAGVRPWWPGLAGFLLACILYLFLLARQPAGPALFRAVLVYFATYHTAFYLSGGQFGPELSGLEMLNSAFWRQRASVAALAMTLAVLYAGAAVGRRGGRRAGHAAVVGLHTTLAVLIALSVQSLVAVLWTGWPPAPGELGLTWSIKYFLDLWQAVALGYGAMGWMIAALIGYALTAPRSGASRGGNRPRTAGGSSRERPPLMVVPSSGRRG